MMFIGVFSLFTRRVREYGKIYADARSVSTGKLVDTITNIWNVKTHSRTLFEEQYLSGYFDEEAGANKRMSNYSEYLQLLQGFMRNVLALGMTLLAAYLWWQGMVSVGDVVLVFSLSMSVLRMARDGTRRMFDLMERISDIRDALDTVVVPHEITDIPSAPMIEMTRGHITFDRVTFAYDGRGNVFENLSLDIPAGQKIGLVGRSGAGKSTLVLLLQRLYDVTGGEIRIDGQNIRSVTADSLRERIAVVPQDTVLFHRSIAENIGYGLDHPSMDQITRAARLAYAQDFIERLPEKYDAKVGERGVKLSGGQRQRIAIARAILRDAPILLLDEATSALDSESEHAIQEALKELMRHRTTLVVAHRLSTLVTLDRILVFEAGQIVEDGSHRELVEHGGIYAELWQRQAGGFIEA